MDPDVSSTHLQELRRGTVVLACLVVLRTPDYGYALLDALSPADQERLAGLLRKLSLDFDEG